MARNLNVRSRVISRSKRLTEWTICSDPTGYSALPLSTKAIAVRVPASTLAEVAPATIVRTRGVVAIKSDQSAAAEEQLGAFGMGFVNTVAGALGITALPGPAADCGWPGWFVHQFFNQSMDFSSAVGLHLDSVIYPIDSKAMRKFKGDEDLVFMVENFGTTGGLEFAVSFRILTKAG